MDALEQRIEELEAHIVDLTEYATVSRLLLMSAARIQMERDADPGRFIERLRDYCLNDDGADEARRAHIERYIDTLERFAPPPRR